MATRTQLLGLYKALLRESQKFASYNFRCYALRRVRDGFRENIRVSDPENLKKVINEAYRNLEIIKRQALISEIYQADKLVIENIPKSQK